MRRLQFFFHSSDSGSVLSSEKKKTTDSDTINAAKPKLADLIHAHWSVDVLIMCFPLLHMK